MKYILISRFLVLTHQRCEKWTLVRGNEKTVDSCWTSLRSVQPTRPVQPTRLIMIIKHSTLNFLTVVAFSLISLLLGSSVYFTKLAHQQNQDAVTR